MKLFTIILSLSLITVFAGQATALDDSEALSGLTSVSAIYDVRTAKENTLQFIFKAIRDTFDETLRQNVKPTYVASMRGPTVKLLVRGRQGDMKVQQETVEMIKKLNKRGVRLEACGYALDLFGLEAEDLYDGVHAVGNSLNSQIGYQTKGYALVTMN